MRARVPSIQILLLLVVIVLLVFVFALPVMPQRYYARNVLTTSPATAGEHLARQPVHAVDGHGQR